MGSNESSRAESGVCAGVPRGGSDGGLLARRAQAFELLGSKGRGGIPRRSGGLVVAMAWIRA